MGAARAALRFCPARPPIRLAASLGAGLLLAVLATTTALACPVCMPPARATVAGPGLSGTVSLVDASTLQGIAITILPGFDPRAPTTAPANGSVGQGYEVIRYYLPIGSQGQTPMPNPSPLAYDHFLYYPAALGRPAMYLYEGSIVHNAQIMPQIDALDALAGKWYTANQREAAAMQAVLANARAPQPVTTATNPAPLTSAHAQTRPASAWWQQTSWLLIASVFAGLVLLVMLTGGLRLLRRPRVRQQRAHVKTSYYPGHRP